MASEKPNFLSQPVVKNIFMFRNGDPYYEARRIVINQKRVSNFETLLREVTGGIQAPFGAVRNIYTPRGGHKVDTLESLQSGEQYVAAGRERFKKMDYLQIGSRRRRLQQTLPSPTKPPGQSRIVVSARFLKPIKEPCTIFVVANGDVLNPAVRLLIHQRMLGQFERILEVITERMGLKVLGGVRSLFTYEGQQVTDGNQLESGQLYVAVGRERFKRLAYSDLLFSKPRGTRRVNGMKANSLPPIYKLSTKHNGNGKSTVRSSDSGGTDPKASPPGFNGNNKEHLSSIVREISQARLISSLRKKRSGQSMTLSISDNDIQESKANDGNSDVKTPEGQPAKEKPEEDNAKAPEEKEENAGGQEEDESSDSRADTEENQEGTAEKGDGDEKKENEAADNEKEGEATEKKEDEEAKRDKDGKEAVGQEEEGEEIKEEVKEVTDENKEEVKSERPGSGTDDKSRDGREKEDGSRASSKDEKDKGGKSTDKETEGNDKENGERIGEDGNNEADKEKGERETENSSDPGKTRSDNETKGSDNGRSSSGNSNQADGKETKEEAEESRKQNGDAGEENDEAESEAEENDSPRAKDADGEKGEGGDKKK